MKRKEEADHASFIGNRRASSGFPMVKRRLNCVESSNLQRVTVLDMSAVSDALSGVAQKLKQKSGGRAKNIDKLLFRKEKWAMLLAQHNRAQHGRCGGGGKSLTDIVAQ